MTNEHGIRPIEYKVLVKPKQVEERTKGGVYLPEVAVERDQHASMEGEIVAVSPFAFSYEEWPDGAAKPTVGQTAIFARYSGVNIKGEDHVEYRLMNDKDVIAVRGAA